MKVVTTMASLSSSDHDWQVCVHMFCDYCSSPTSLDFTKQWFLYVCHWWSPRNEAFKSTMSDNAQKKMKWEWEDGCYGTRVDPTVTPGQERKKYLPRPTADRISGVSIVNIICTHILIARNVQFSITGLMPLHNAVIFYLKQVNWLKV